MLGQLSEDKRRGGLTLPEDVLLDASYGAWGNVLDYAVDGVSFGTDLSQWPVPFGIAGGLLDRDTGLVRFGARDYDPSIGRWTAKDQLWASCPAAH
jgi:RHS repeat-associated protein